MNDKQRPDPSLGLFGISPTTVGNGLNVYFENGYDAVMRLYPEFKFFWEYVKRIEEKKVREVVKYTLEQAAENGKAVHHFQAGDEDYATGASVIKQSILSLEDKIIKDLKL